MKLLTKAIAAKLLANGAISAAGTDHDPKPVVKFFNPCGAATWLISEMADDGDTLFGLCDLGMGCPELGSVSLNELQTTKLRFGLGIERDLHWTADKTLGEYAAEARDEGRIAA